MKRCALLALIAGTLVLLLTGCGQKQDERILHVGVRSDVINFGYRNPESGRYYGLGIDLAGELAQRLGYTATVFTTVTADNREQTLESGTVDCLIAAYTITPERQERFDFSAPYYTDSLRVIVENTTGFTALSDLMGAIVGVRQHTTAAEELCRAMDAQGLLTGFDADTFDAQTFNGGVSFICYESYDDLDLALEVGAVDAICMDGSFASSLMSGSRLMMEEAFSAQSYGVATRKGSGLSAPIAQAVTDMEQDGTLALLMDKWD